MTRLGLGLVLVATLGLLVAPSGGAKVVNENIDNLPPGCNEISTTREITVRGGSEFARNFTGVAYTFERHSWEVEPCARVTVTFVNTDEIRHQFMIHGTWPNGFTLIEVDGPGRDTATWITPSDATSLMVHCGVNQHQQKGMKAQFLVDGGVGDVPNIPGVSGLPPEDRPAYASNESEQQRAAGLGPGAALVAVAAGLLLARRGTR